MKSLMEEEETLVLGGLYAWRLEVGFLDPKYLYVTVLKCKRLSFREPSFSCFVMWADGTCENTVMEPRCWRRVL